MPTADQVAKWSDDFEEIYPDTLSERLRWFHQKLGADEERLLRLVGLPDTEVKKLGEGGSVDWKRVAKQYPDGAAWAEEMLLQAVAYFDYNWEGLREHIRQPLRAEYRIGKPGNGEPLRALAKEEQDNRLLGLIADGDERSAPALIVYLSPAPAS